MSVVLAVVQAAAAVMLLVPLVIVAVCALRRAGRKVDQILLEECGPDVPDQAARIPAQNHDMRRPAGPVARATGDSPVR
jgi:hypothetical protein